ncbi:MAG: outer membrane lipoprotein-sorting protein [candidate division WOR-3 bacterium]
MFRIFLFLVSLTAEELLKKIDEIKTPLKSQATVEMRNYLRGGREVTYKIKIISERKKASYLEVLEPIREKGRKFLLIGNDIWMYAPEVGKSLRLSIRDRFLGSEFSNSDLMESSYEKNFKATSIDSTLDFYFLELEGKSKEAPYKKITMKVRKKNYLPAELKFYTLSGRLYKEMFLDSLKVFEGQLYTTYMKMINVLNPESYTEVKIISLKTLQSISPSLFKPENLKK